MKTQAFLTNRTLILGIVITIFISLLLPSGNIFSQNIFSVSANKLNDSCVLVSFTGKRVQQVNYINCAIQCELKCYFLVLERSVDGGTFIPFSCKKGQISPGNQIIQFSFIDNSTSTSVKYKIAVYTSVSSSKNGNVYTVSENLLNEFENSIISVDENTNEVPTEVTASRK